MRRFGFVYVLANPAFPGLFKIGCTERAPSARAAELSRSSGVPASFEVLCYIEAVDFQRVETDLHSYLAWHRVNDSREFFRDALVKAIPWLYHHPDRLTFCDAIRRPNPPLLVDPDLLGNTGWESFYAMPNPWEPVP